VQANHVPVFKKGGEGKKEGGKKKKKVKKVVSVSEKN